MNIIQHANDVLKHVRSKSNRVILFFSGGGKDGLALLHMAAQHFDEVVICFMYIVKGLEHQEKYLRWAESAYPNVKVLRCPHWNLTYILRSGMYCTQQPHVKLMKLADVDEAVKIKTGINWSLYGMKKADGMDRNIMLKGYEMQAISTTNKAYQLSLWRKDDVLKYIQLNNLPQPMSYRSGKKSVGLSFDTDVFVWLREHYPNDLEKILTQFPLSGRLLFDYDRKQSNL